MQFRRFTIGVSTPRPGGLISYGIHYVSAYRQLGIYAAKILNGTKPANLHTIAGWQAQKGTQRTEQIRAPLD